LEQLFEIGSAATRDPLPTMAPNKAPAQSRTALLPSENASRRGGWELTNYVKSSLGLVCDIQISDEITPGKGPSAWSETGSFQLSTACGLKLPGVFQKVSLASL